MKPQERTRAVLRSGLPSTARLVLIALVDHLSDDDGAAWPSVPTVAERTGLNARTVRRTLRDLEAAGVLARDAHIGRSSDYRVSWARLAEYVPTPDTRSAPRTEDPPGQRIRPPRTEDPPPPDTRSAPPRTEDPPKGPLEGTSEGTNEGTTNGSAAPLESNDAAPPPKAEVVPTWTPSAKLCAGYPRRAVADAVIEVVAAVRQKPVNPDRCATDARAVLALWRALGRPPPDELAADGALVAEWARLAPDRLAARDLRAEGWPDGTDRSASVATLTRHTSWGDRLEAAKAWSARGRPTSVVGLRQQAKPGRRKTVSELLREREGQPENGVIDATCEVI